MLEGDILQSDTPPKPVLETQQEAAKVLLRNTIFFVMADAFTKVISFIFNVFVVRQLGGEQFGLYSAAVAYVGIFSIIADLGMTQYSIREIARGRRQADDLFWNLVIIRLLLSLLANALITASAHFVAGYPPVMVWGIFLASFGFFFHSFWGPVQVILLAKERGDYVSTLGTLIQLFFVLVGTFVLLRGYAFHGLIIASYVGVPLSAIVGIIYVRKLRLATFAFKVAPHIWRSILQYSLPFALSTFTLVASNDLDTVLLSLWRTPEEVGWYKAAYNLIFKLLFITGPILATLGPQMSRYYGVSKDRVAKIFHSFFKILYITYLPVALGTSLLADRIIIWLYTDKFGESGPVLAILIWALIPVNLSYLCGTVSIATDKEKQAAKIYALAALTNLALNLIAIPLWGYIGSAVATVATEGIILILFYSVLHREFPLTDLKNVLFKPLLAGLVMAGMLLVMQELPLLVIIGLGGLIYSLVLFVLKPFDQTELEIIGGFWQALRARLTGGAAS